MKQIKITFSIYLFLFLVVISSSCKKKSEDPTPTNTSNNTSNNNANNNSTSSDAICEFSASIDGTAVDFKVVTGNEPYEAGVGAYGDVGDGSNGPTKRGYSADMSVNNSKEYFRINKGTLVKQAGGYPNTSEFNSFFNKGTLSYSDDAANGIQIAYTDKNGTTWTSNGSQTGSTFNFTSIEYASILGEDVVNFTATFNCTLYDGTGNSKKLTNGYAKLSFENM